MFQVVLYEPEIPQNTGNIMRTCVAIGAKLHLIEPLGFKIDDKKLKRSALDYYAHLNHEIHRNFDAFREKNPGTYLFLTRYGQKTYTDIDYKQMKEPLFLVFGKESTGVDRSLLAAHLEDCYRIPTNDHVRSLNLSNAVAIVCYEALRQFDFPNLIKTEPETLKGKHFLDQFKKEDNT
ncbi:MAG: tRNA (cytidine(34)-2'-O)-methyltransferase [Acholeplasmataceae bacterium]|nr:tRNA (cytidine(34)-2'-O)-methyltransferase [Acholeplasmataceae bacterium]